MRGLYGQGVWFPDRINRKVNILPIQCIIPFIKRLMTLVGASSRLIHTRPTIVCFQRKGISVERAGSITSGWIITWGAYIVSAPLICTIINNLNNREIYEPYHHTTCACCYEIYRTDFLTPIILTGECEQQWANLNWFVCIECECATPSDPWKCMYACYFYALDMPNFECQIQARDSFPAICSR